jgi:phytoene/squalene synthetase
VTALARRVLSDCYIALRLLEDEAQEDVWAVHWAGALALIGAVNDVLKLAKKRSSLRKAYEKHHNAWIDEASGQHEIFRKFIKEERNFLLHEYATSVDLRREVPILVDDGRPAYLSPEADATAAAAAIEFSLDQNIFRPMKTGPWQNEDARDVYELALDWWKAQLASIDLEVMNTKAP